MSGSCRMLHQVSARACDYTIDKPTSGRVAASSHGFVWTGAILVHMSTSNRHAATALALLMLVVTGCGGGNSDTVDPGAGLEDQRATVDSEFERAVEEARYLREDIAAVRADMRAVREAADSEARRASEEAASLRQEIAALRLEMQQLSDGAAYEVERAASEVKRATEEAKSLREEIAEIRAEMSAVNEVTQGADSLSSEEIAGSLAGEDSYSEAVVIERQVPYTSRSARRRYRGPQPVIYNPPHYSQRRVLAQARQFRRETNRQGSSGSKATNTKPAAPSKPNVSTSKPSAPSARPAAPASRPAPRATRSTQQKPVHIPQHER